ncbi:HFL041Cp [Eremothecium sinecaudum]|uniref:Large ribosomal subunit protein mL50 n=1 Tax=Eremothecium sinecaudum TaxID=45286 RepID=A0A0X8HUU5_9SACH|nr:HFL041Cp [Eremothecium sinecaudum]AMD21815.1 HFL041Cp [Eremothecium sinecaudum]
MLARQCLLLYSKRSLHAAPPAKNILSWLRSRKDGKEKTPAKDTKALIKEIESGETAFSASKQSVVTLALDESDFIGVDVEAENERRYKEMVQSSKLNIWLQPKKVASVEQLKELVISSFNDASNVKVSSIDDPLLTENFTDLVCKFKFIKQLQAKTGYMIPDEKITRLLSPVSFLQWYDAEVLSGKLLGYNEAEPNAIDLSKKEFPPNVFITPLIKKREMMNNMDQILSEVEALEKEKAVSAISNAIRS